jgi:hypothetical protein
VRLCVHNHSATSDSRNPQQQNIQKLLTPWYHHLCYEPYTYNKAMLLYIPRTMMMMARVVADNSVLKLTLWQMEKRYP